MGADQGRMTDRGWLAFALSVVTVVPIAQAIAVFLLGWDTHPGGAVLTVGLISAGLFGFLSRASAVTPGAAFGGYLVAAALTVPWGLGLFFLALSVACYGKDQCFS